MFVGASSPLTFAVRCQISVLPDFGGELCRLVSVQSKADSQTIAGSLVDAPDGTAAVGPGFGEENERPGACVL